MPAFPEPLHPAVVHFPIVFILIGSAVAVAAVFWQKWSLPYVTAGLLALGAIGAVVAVNTGEADGELAGVSAGTAGTLLDEHEDWAERTQVAAIAAGVLAIAAAAVLRWPRIRRITASVAAVGALTASWCVFETGHRGGRLVYDHALGVLSADTSTQATAPDRPAGQHDDDD